jgi:hypothetical protein
MAFPFCGAQKTSLQGTFLCVSLPDIAYGAIEISPEETELPLSRRKLRPVLVRLDDDQIQQITRNKAPGESRAGFVRTAIGAEIKRRNHTGNTTRKASAKVPHGD